MVVKKTNDLDFILLSGNSNLELAKKVSDHLEIPLCKTKINIFSDGEIQVEIHETLRRREVVIMQSTCKSEGRSVNDNLIELLLLVDAAKRSSAERITVVLPYYGYARQDKKVAPRVPISAKLVADLIDKACSKVPYVIIGMDFHAPQIQGFVDGPADNMSAWPALFNHVQDNFKRDLLVIVSPDAGGMERARAFAKRLGVGVAMVDKRRSAPNKAEAMMIIGKVEGKIAIILDDMVDTAGTITKGADKIIEKGAIEVHVLCTHPVLSGKAIERLKESKIISLVVTDTIPLSSQVRTCDKIQTISVSKIIAEAIKRSYNGESVSDMFLNE